MGGLIIKAVGRAKMRDGNPLPSLHPMSNAPRGAVGLLLDATPTVWTSLDEFHCKLARGLNARGVPVVIVYSDKPRPDYLEHMQSCGAFISAVNYNIGKYRYFRRIGEILRSNGVRVIQTRGFNYFSGLWWILWLNGIRHMTFVEGNSGLLRATGLKKRLLQIRTKLITAPITRTVTVTNFVKQQLVEIGMTPGRIQAIYNGVDLNRFQPDPAARVAWRSRFQIAEDELVISTISYLRPFKNPHVILKAVALLVARNIPVRLFVAGDGELLEPMKNLARELRIEGRVHWLGNFAETEHLLQGSDIFVLASVGEAIGNVLLEAMACGLPSVGTRSGGIPEIIEDGVTGFLAKPLDAADFACQMGRLAEDGRLRSRMSTASVERARSRFAVDVTVENFLKVYESLGMFGRAQSA
jgi:glycosyltransferase involved in cell wall biosynthesis